MVDTTENNLAALSDDCLVHELFRRYPTAFIACGTHAGDFWNTQQGDAFAVVGMIEHAKHRILRPTLDDIL
jgi:hypothetical protein